MPKPSYHAVRRVFRSAIPFSTDRPWPRISVVVAAHNAARTIENTLESLAMLHYPDYEVIMVDDGSTDGTADIARRYPAFQLISTPNRGLSAARNEGLRRATGQIVAYIDADARADSDWLLYIATTYLTEDVVGVGGPNPVPPEDNWIAKCVYRSPGGPTQVMVDDRYAEHIPGCNMTFLKCVLEEIGGFDPIFTAAGDDVDICWRLIEKGYRIGFSPAAVVWHHRRQSVRGYWRQQVGYGLAECQLERKHPNRFNPWGHLSWSGRIYGSHPSFRIFARPSIYYGLWGSAGFQPMYDPGGGSILHSLPRAMEWHLGLAALLVAGVFFPWAFALLAICLAYTGVHCAACAGQARLHVLESAGTPSSLLERLKWRATIACLHFIEPVARDWGRLKGGLTPWRSAPMWTCPAGYASKWWQRLQPFQRRVKSAHHSSVWFEKCAFLALLTRKLSKMGWALGWNPENHRWDLKIRRGALAEGVVAVVVEHNGSLARASAELRSSSDLVQLQMILVTALAGAVAWSADVLAALLALVFGVLWILSILEANRLELALLSAAQETAAELGLGTRRRPPPARDTELEQSHGADESAERLVAGA